MLILRREQPEDAAAVRAIVTAAFAPMGFADGTEPDLTPALRRAGGLALSLVAQYDGILCGQLALSPATHDSGVAGWFALGPLAIAPGKQRQGIGTALIRAAQGWMAGQGAAGCILLGDTGYYPRFGFLPKPSHAPRGLPPAHFMVWSLTGQVPPGRFAFHPVFGAA